MDIVERGTSIDGACGLRAISTWEAREMGVTPGQLAGPGWTSPTRGVHRPVAPDGSSCDSLAAARQRIYDVAELLPPGAAIGGWAAAHLLGARDLDGRGRSGQEFQPVPVVLPPPMLIRARPDLERWRSSLVDEDVTLVQGIPCTGVVRTGFDLVRRHDLRAAVTALDVMSRQVGLDPSDVLELSKARRRWRGVPRVAPAVSLADPRALSPGETRLRLVWVLDAELPSPQVNPTVRDLRRPLHALGDLLDPAAALIGEYDGEAHRQLDQHIADNAREEWLEDAGLIVVRAGSLDLLQSGRPALVHRLHAAYRRGIARDRSRDRWTWSPTPLEDLRRLATG